MKKTRKVLSVLLTLCMVLTMMPVTAWAGEPPPFSISTGTLYPTLKDTLLNAPNGATITLENSFTVADPITINGKNITFDLNGKILNVAVASGTALLVSGGSLSLSGAGALNVTSNAGNGVVVTGSGSRAEVTNATATGSNSIGAYAEGESQFNFITVTGNATASGNNSTGACGSGGGSVTVNGNATATGHGSIGVSTNCGAAVSTITVSGEVSATGVECFGVSNNGGDITVGGSVTATGDYNVGADNQYGYLTVNGDVIATGWDSTGVNCEGLTVTVKGSIIAHNYARVDTVLKTAADGIGGTGSYEGYNVFSTDSGSNPIRLLVKFHITNGTDGKYYTCLTEAIAAAHDGEVIKLLNNITESVRYTVSSDKDITIDGNGKTLTGVNDSVGTAFNLMGDGVVIFKNLNILGGSGASVSSGLYIEDSVSVQSKGTVTVTGGTGIDESIGLQNYSTGILDIGTVTGGIGQSSYGVKNYGSGVINVNTATAGTSVNESYGVRNNSGGTVNVHTAIDNGHNGFAVFNFGIGAVNVNTAMADRCAAHNSGPGTVNVGTATGDVEGVGPINTGASVAAITLNKGTGASCVLDSITVAATGNTTIGTLPSVSKDGIVGAWYTDSAKTATFSGITVSGAAILYSTFYTEAVAHTGGGGGGVGTSAAPPAGTATTGNTTTATTTSETKTDASGGAAASVTGAQLNDAIAKAVAGANAQGGESDAVVEIKVTGASSAKSISTTIPQAAFSELSGSSADGLKISTPLASITFDGAALDAINGKAAGDIKITTALADTSKLSDAEKAAVGDRPVYDLTITSGNTTISSFGGGSAAISVPYTLAAGEDANKIVIYYLADSGELVLLSNCSYDTKTGLVTFITNHFSNYAVGYNNVSFSDVSGWYAEYVNYLAARGIINGSNGKFNPGSDITRAQFVTILANLSGADLSSDTATSFSDVKTTAWYFGATQWAYKTGVSTGTDGKFNPNAKITRQDMAVMIARYTEKVAAYTLPETNGKVEFTDSADIADYAKTAVTSMKQADIISGNADGSFAPKDNASRAQAAKMIALLLQEMI